MAPSKEKRSFKKEREQRILLSCVERFLETGKPVGSQSLQEEGFADLSSATIRNYFALLEGQGLLEQQHSSGGRIPTWKGLRYYIASLKVEVDEKPFSSLQAIEGKEVEKILREAVSLLSLETSAVAAVTAPRFEHDLVIKLVPVALAHDVLAVLIYTALGDVRVEPFRLLGVNPDLAKRMEAGFAQLLEGSSLEEGGFSKKEAEKIFSVYQEILVRHISYNTSFAKAALHKAGLPKLLQGLELNDREVLARVFSLYEDEDLLRGLSQEICKQKKFSYWLGEDWERWGEKSMGLTVLGVPYFLHTQAAGALFVMAPAKCAYKEIKASLLSLESVLSRLLTEKLFQHKISYRLPKENLFLSEEDLAPMGRTGGFFLKHQ